MKRNIKTLVWILLVVLVALTLWIRQTQLNPITIQSQEGELNAGNLTVPDLEFRLLDEEANRSHVTFREMNDGFSHLINDSSINVNPSQEVYDDVYSSFSLLDRPNLREYAVVNPDSAQQFWYRSPYLLDVEEGELMTFAYTLIDLETDTYKEHAYEFEHSEIGFYTYMSYAEDASNYYIVLELMNLDRAVQEINQLTIDKESGEVTESQTIDHDLNDYIPFSSAFQQLKHPSLHLFIKHLAPQERMSGDPNYLVNSNNVEVAVINPETMEFEEIKLDQSASSEVNPNTGASYAIVREDQLFYLEIENTFSEDQASYSMELTMYEYDFEEATLNEIWQKELAGDQASSKSSTYRLMSGQLFIATVEDGKHARLEHIDVESGDITGEKVYQISADSSYQFANVSFRQYYN